MKKTAWLVAMIVAAPVAAAPARAHNPILRKAGMIQPPPGWHADADQASALDQRFAAAPHFGGRPTVTSAVAYVPDQPGVALFVTKATVQVGDASIGALARSALDELRASSRRAALTGARAEETKWKEGVDDHDQRVWAALTWHDPSTHSGEEAWIEVVSDGKQVVAVTSECVMDDAADREAQGACILAVNSTETDIALAARVAIALPAAGEPPAAVAPAMSPLPGAHGLDDGTVVLPPQRIALDPPATDRRPVVLGAGLILLAAVFWWNRKRREQIERADARHDRRERNRRAAARDADADDLHAAARGDHHEPDEPA